ncbi:MAG: aspartyl/asparaginyl beta-hydroxylase domain-containing protein [Planctomycetota bacterium]
MFLEPADFPFVRVLEERFETFRREAAALRREDYVPWPEKEAALGEWLVFPLIVESYREFLGIDLGPFRSRCPKSTAILEGLGNVAIGGFSRLEPGAHILPHVDGQGRGVVRCHLGLRVPPRGYLRMAGEVRTWEEGKCLVFDVNVLHDAANLGTEPRVVLLADIRIPSERPGPGTPATPR